MYETHLEHFVPASRVNAEISEEIQSMRADLERRASYKERVKDYRHRFQRLIPPWISAQSPFKASPASSYDF
jgi:hypothetical protein